MQMSGYRRDSADVENKRDSAGIEKRKDEALDAVGTQDAVGTLGAAGTLDAAAERGAAGAREKRREALEAAEAFGCCSDYRKCSEIGKCLRGKPPCAYRERLEAGKCFYGKRADGFSMERYSEICGKVAALSQPARQALDNLLIVFQEYYRAIPFYIVRNQWTDEIAGTGLFEFRPLGRMFPPAKEEKWDAQKIRGMVTENAEYAPLFQKAQEERAKELAPFREAVKSAESEKEKDKRQEALKSKLKETPSEDSKRFLREWLDHEGAALRDKLADAYRAAYYADASAHIYAGELYQDTLFSSYDSRIYKPSPFAEDGILTAATRKTEEVRRVKFSRGYDADEKTRLLAELGEG